MDLIIGNIAFFLSWPINAQRQILVSGTTSNETAAGRQTANKQQ
jgi:hypothetical protein